MKTVKCACIADGFFAIDYYFAENEDGSVPSWEAGYAHYNIHRPKDLYEIAKEYRKIDRGYCGIELGKNYTMKKATNDFNRYAK